MSSRRHRKALEAEESDGGAAALGAVSDMFEKYRGKLNVTITLEVIQKTALLATAGLLRKVFPSKFGRGSQLAFPLKEDFFVLLLPVHA